MAKGRSPKAAKPARPKKTGKQLVVTLSASSGEIEKVEELGSTGKRRTFSEAEFAKLAGDDGLEDVCEALEAAYLAGIQDGLDDSQSDEFSAEMSSEQRGQEQFGEGVLRFGIRRIILRRAARRRLEQANRKVTHNGAHNAR